MDERYYRLGFSVFPGIGPKRFRQLVDYFGSAQGAWEGDEATIRRILGKVYGESFITFRQSFSPEAYVLQLQSAGVWFVGGEDNEYPELLKELVTPPIVLYGRGDKKVLSMHATSIGIVGTRKISSYGKEVTQSLTKFLVANGCVIVSGLAMGVDALAHSTTIEQGGKTIAVLGSGVDVCHPAVNTSLYNNIIAGNGAVISEYPLGEPPSKGSFPSRNRIIAGLSQAIVVTEGTADSGALYTAHDTFALNRIVFAVPGPITSSLSKAPNTLLTKGATLVTSGEDILLELGVEGSRRDKGIRKEIQGDTDDEQKIIDLLHQESLSFDEIVRKTKKDSGEIGVLLSLMELKGIIKNTEAGFSL